MKSMIQLLILALALALSQSALANNICETNRENPFFFSSQTPKKLQRKQMRMARRVLRQVRSSKREGLQAFSIKAYSGQIISSDGAIIFSEGSEDNIADHIINTTETVIAAGGDVVDTAVAGWSCFTGGVSNFFKDNPVSGSAEMVTCVFQYSSYAIAVGFEGGEDTTNALADTAEVIIDKTAHVLAQFSFTIGDSLEEALGGGPLGQLVNTPFEIIGIFVEATGEVLIAVVHIIDDTVSVIFSNGGRIACSLGDAFGELGKFHVGEFLVILVGQIPAQILFMPIDIIDTVIFKGIFNGAFGRGGSNKPMSVKPYRAPLWVPETVEPGSYPYPSDCKVVHGLGGTQYSDPSCEERFNLWRKSAPEWTVEGSYPYPSDCKVVHGLGGTQYSDPSCEERLNLWRKSAPEWTIEKRKNLGEPQMRGGYGGGG